MQISIKTSPKTNNPQAQALKNPQLHKKNKPKFSGKPQVWQHWRLSKALKDALSKEPSNLRVRASRF